MGTLGGLILDENGDAKSGVGKCRGEEDAGEVDVDQVPKLNQMSLIEEISVIITTAISAIMASLNKVSPSTSYFFEFRIMVIFELPCHLHNY